MLKPSRVIIRSTVSLLVAPLSTARLSKITIVAGCNVKDATIFRSEIGFFGRPMKKGGGPLLIVFVLY